jgi:hypothetical protein
LSCSLQDLAVAGNVLKGDITGAVAAGVAAGAANKAMKNDPKP